MVISIRLAKRTRGVMCKRRDWLTQRIKVKPEASFDHSERQALNFSIGVLTALIEGQKVEVQDGRYRSRTLDKQTQERTNGKGAEVESGTEIPFTPFVC